MAFYSYHRGHRYNVILRDAETIYLDAVDLITSYEGFSPSSKLRYLMREHCAWFPVGRPDLTVLCVWPEAQTRQNRVWIERFCQEPAMTPQQRVVFDEVARMIARGEEVLAALLNAKTLTALRERHELVYIEKGVVQLTCLGNHIAWLRDNPQPRRPAFGDPSIPPPRDRPR